MKKRISEKTFCYIFHSLVLIMFMILFYHCLGQTGKNSTTNMQDEHIYFFADSLLLNVFFGGLAIIVLCFVGRLSAKMQSMKVRNIILAIVCVLTALISYFWIYAGKFQPVADQWYICVYAELFNTGNFSALEKGGYVAMYPQQLGMITLLRIIFTFFGSMNYAAFQYLSASLIPLMVLAGCNIVRILSDNDAKTELYYLLFMVICFPMYAYTPYVYGDLISTVFSMLALWMLLACLKKFSWGKMILFGLFIGISVQLRKNVLILAVAMALVLLIKLIFQFKKQNLILLLSLILGVVFFDALIGFVYRDVHTQDVGIPASLYVIMGLNDDNGFPGWHNGYEISTFESVGGDGELATQKAMEDLKIYMNLYKNDPQYMIDFFARKMNSQWNAPMYHSMAMNTYFEEEQLAPVKQLYQYGTLTKLLDFVMKIYQLVLYGSILFLLLVRRKDFVQLEKYLLLIAVYGGFLFSFIWEAKTRYIMPYLFMMIPYMAMGVKLIAATLEHKFVKKSEENPLESVA